MPDTPNTSQRGAGAPAASMPSAAQLSYLRALAGQTGTSFAYPASKAQASREIARIKALACRDDRRLQRDEIRRERRAISVDLAERGHDAVAIHDDEIVGWGSSARWS